MTSLTPNSLRKLIDNKEIFNHFIYLQAKLKNNYLNNISYYDKDILEAIQESPNTTNWVKDIVLPKIYEGDIGLDEILITIETEENNLISATKMQILMDILQSIPENLNKLKDKAVEGEYDVNKNIQNFSERITYKVLH